MQIDSRIPPFLQSGIAAVDPAILHALHAGKAANHRGFTAVFLLIWYQEPSE
jgi:alanine-alpha-ketoisovalerate/valine-pyruvate aminotransferase